MAKSVITKANLILDQLGVQMSNRRTVAATEQKMEAAGQEVFL